MNTLRTGMLLALMTGIFVAVGAMIGGSSGVLIAFGMALAMNLFAYWNSDKVLLRMYGARQVDAASEPEIFAMVQRLAANAQLPMPLIRPASSAAGMNSEGGMAPSSGSSRRMSASKPASSPERMW